MDEISAILGGVYLDGPDEELRAALVKLEALCTPEGLARLPRKRRKKVRHHALMSLKILRMSMQLRGAG